MLNTQTLTPQEALERRRAVDNAIGTNRIEGIEPDNEQKEIMERYASGQINIDEMKTQMRSHFATLL